MPFPFRMITPERILAEGQADMVTLRSADGDIAFLAGHVPYIGAVQTCMVAVHGPDERFAVHGGFVEVSGGELVLLAGVAERVGEIDVERARRALAQAQAQGTEDELAVRRAQVRLELAGVSS